MADVEVKKDLQQSSQAAYVGFWAGIFRLLEGPLSRILSIVGIGLIVLAALGGIPKVQQFSPAQLPWIFTVGILLLVAGLIGLVIPSIRDEAGKGQFRSVLIVIMVLALLSIIVILLSFFGIGKIFASSNQHTDLDVAVIALTLFTCCGFLPAYFGASYLQDRFGEIDEKLKDFRSIHEDLKTTPNTIDQQILRLTASENDLLAHLKSREDELVSKVEDATRSLLKTFDAVFGKAFSMIKDAQDQLIFVNFAMNFGAPHLYKPEVAEAYAKRYAGANFATDVAEFFSTLKLKVVSVPEVQILTVTNNGASENFLEPLSQRVGYERLQQNPILKKELKAAIDSKEIIERNIKQEVLDRGDNSGSRRLLEAESLPIQLLITGLPHSISSPKKFGCLVFMAGTEMLQNKEADAPAFYTELDEMVDVFRNLAWALIDAANRKSQQN